MTGPELLATLRDLRRAGQLAQAQALLGQLKKSHPTDDALNLLAWQHADFWWQPLQGLRTTLSRRGPADLPLVRRCWTDAAFMGRFNRMALELPASDEALGALLGREHWALPQESRALHWTVHRDGRAQGFVSLVDISLPHRRAEFLMGVVSTARSRIAAEAAHLVLGFAAAQARLQRLFAHFYPENPAALAAALHLGFRQEGVLHQHMLLPSGQRSDLIVAGLLLDQSFFDQHSRLRRRLLGPAADIALKG